GGYANAGAVLDLPCLMILGPFFTAALDLLATLVIQGFAQRKPAVKVVHNMAIFAITDFAAGYTFLATGGEVGHLSLARNIVPILACGIIYFLSNSVLVSTVIGLTSGPNPWRVWPR